MKIIYTTPTTVAPLLRHRRYRRKRGCLVSGNENILLKIRGLLPSLTAGEKKIGNYVLRYPDKVVKLSITELAEACGVSDATIFRFCRKVGTEGYQDFKITLAKSRLRKIASSMPMSSLRTL